mmetsp:Transcript_18546/g.31065  ORF Transcript_18546/g.31065 Transcript_18546/m.31065 type:complete len:219 (+) Transcript_18546:164-820(+)
MADRTSISSATGGSRPSMESGGGNNRSSVSSGDNRNSTGSGGGGNRKSTGSGGASTKPDDVGDVAASFGENNLEKKQAVVEKYYESNITLENIEEAGAAIKDFIRNDVGQAVGGAFSVVKKQLTPGFVNRFYAKKVHMEDIEKSEVKLDKLSVAANKMIKDELVYKKERQRHSTSLLQRQDAFFSIITKKGWFPNIFMVKKECFIPVFQPDCGLCYLH